MTHGPIKYNREYYYKQLKRPDFIVSIINTLMLLSLFIFLMRSYIIYFKYGHQVYIYRFIIVLISLGLIFLNFYAISKHTAQDVYLRDYKTIRRALNSNDGMGRAFSKHSTILRSSYSTCILSCVLAFTRVFFENNFSLFLILPLVCIIGLISISMFYYAKHPIYQCESLSITNIFHVKDYGNVFGPMSVILFLLEILMYGLAFIQVIIVYIVYVINRVKYYGLESIHYNGTKLTVEHVGNKIYTLKRFSMSKIVKIIKHKKLKGKIIRISKSHMINICNNRYLHALNPKITNICEILLLILFILLLLSLIFILTLSFIYAINNHLYGYKILSFAIESLCDVLKFLMISAPSIVTMNHLIIYFENNPSYINMNSAILILLFFPFVTIFYLLYTFKSLNKIEV